MSEVKRDENGMIMPIKTTYPALASEKSKLSNVYGKGDNYIVGTYGNYLIDTDRDFELLAPAPYDRMYEVYCAAQIDRDYEEAERYSVDMSVYNQLRQDFGVFWFRTHPQKKRYNFHIG